jgi:hypothetical protein
MQDTQRRRTVEAPFICNVVDQQNAHSASVVGRGDGPETLLPGGIPYLQLHALAVELDGADFEVDADGGDERGRERVLTEAQQTA